MVIQNEIHPLNNDEELIRYYQSLGIVVQAYSPLCRMIPQISEQPVLQELARKYQVSIPQLILRWHAYRGVVPIVKTSKPQRVEENIAALDFEIDTSDMELINGLNSDFRVFLESRCCPGF